MDRYFDAFSRGALIEQLKRLSTKSTGSAPDRDSRSHPTASDHEGILSSSNGSASASFSYSSVESAEAMDRAHD